MGHVSSSSVPLNGQSSNLPGREYRRSRPAGNSDPIDNRNSIGDLGEILACRFLTSHGVLVLARNVQLDHGEVDIVVKDNSVFALVEVRTLTGSIYPLDAVDDAKRRQLRLLAGRLSLGRIDLVGVGIGTHDVVFHWDPDSV